MVDIEVSLKTGVLPSPLDGGTPVLSDIDEVSLKTGVPPSPLYHLRSLGDGIERG